MRDAIPCSILLSILTSCRYVKDVRRYPVSNHMSLFVRDVVTEEVEFRQQSRHVIDC